MFIQRKRKTTSPLHDPQNQIFDASILNGQNYLYAPLRVLDLDLLAMFAGDQTVNKFKFPCGAPLILHVAHLNFAVARHRESYLRQDIYIQMQSTRLLCLLMKYTTNSVLEA